MKNRLLHQDAPSTLGLSLETSLRYTFLLRRERDGLEAAEVALEAA